MRWPGQMPGGPKEEPFPAVSRVRLRSLQAAQSGPEPAIPPGITERQMLSVLPPPGTRGAGRWGLGSRRSDIEPPDRALARL